MNILIKPPSKSITAPQKHLAATVVRVVIDVGFCVCAVS